MNLEQGIAHNSWGRVIFHVEDVDEFWRYLKSKGFDPPSPRDAPWGERYFHLHDPDGHELSFAPDGVASVVAFFGFSLTGKLHRKVVS